MSPLLHSDVIWLRQRVLCFARKSLLTDEAREITRIGALDPRNKEKGYGSPFCGHWRTLLTTAPRISVSDASPSRFQQVWGSFWHIFVEAVTVGQKQVAVASHEVLNELKLPNSRDLNSHSLMLHVDERSRHSDYKLRHAFFQEFFSNESPGSVLPERACFQTSSESELIN